MGLLEACLDSRFLQRETVGRISLLVCHSFLAGYLGEVTERVVLGINELVPESAGKSRHRSQDSYQLAFIQH